MSLSNSKKCISENQENVPPLIEVVDEKKYDNVDHRPTLGQILVEASNTKVVETDKVNTNQVETVKNQPLEASTLCDESLCHQSSDGLFDDPPLPNEQPTDNLLQSETLEELVPLKNVDESFHLQKSLVKNETLKPLSVESEMPSHSTCVDYPVPLKTASEGQLSTKSACVKESLGLESGDHLESSIKQQLPCIQSNLPKWYEDIAHLDERERWKERNIVLTSLEHKENIKIAQSILDDVLNMVFAKILPVNSEAKTEKISETTSSNHAQPSMEAPPVIEPSTEDVGIGHLNDSSQDPIPSKYVSDFSESNIYSVRIEDISSEEEVFLSPPQSPCNATRSLEVCTTANLDVISVNSDRISSCGSNYLSCVEQHLEESLLSDNSLLNISHSTDFQELFLQADSPVENSNSTRANINNILCKLSTEPILSVTNDKSLHQNLNSESKLSSSAISNLASGEECSKVIVRSSEYASQYPKIDIEDEAIKSIRGDADNLLVSCKEIIHTNDVEPQVTNDLLGSSIDSSETRMVSAVNKELSFIPGCESRVQSSMFMEGLNPEQGEVSVEKPLGVCFSFNDSNAKDGEVSSNLLSLSSDLPEDLSVEQDQTVLECQPLESTSSKQHLGEYLSKDLSISFIDTLNNNKQEDIVYHELQSNTNITHLLNSDINSDCSKLSYNDLKNNNAIQNITDSQDNEENTANNNCKFPLLDQSPTENKGKALSDSAFVQCSHSCDISSHPPVEDGACRTSQSIIGGIISKDMASDENVPQVEILLQQEKGMTEKNRPKCEVHESNIQDNHGSCSQDENYMKTCVLSGVENMETESFKTDENTESLSHVNFSKVAPSTNNSVLEMSSDQISDSSLLAKPVHFEIGDGDTVPDHLSGYPPYVETEHAMKGDDLQAISDEDAEITLINDTKSQDAATGLEMTFTDVADSNTMEPVTFGDGFSCGGQILEDLPIASSASEGSEVEEFYSATEFFTDPAAFDFLQNAGTSKIAEESKFTRISLFQKFDPLLKVQSPVKMQSERKALCTEVAVSKWNKLDIPEENEDICDSQIVPILEQKSLIHVSPENSQTSKLIDLSLSPNQEKNTSEMELTEQSQVMYDECEMQQILKKQELLFQEQLINKDRVGQEKVNANKKEIENLRKERLILEQAIFSTRGVTEEVMSAMAFLMQKTEEDRIEITTSKHQIIAERDQALEDLKGVERAFSDLHHRYEKSKKLLETMKQNEERWKQQLEDIQTRISEHQQMYEMLKQRSEEKLESVSIDLDEANRAADSERVVMQAMLRKADMKIDSLEKNLEQKVREIEELSSIYEDLVTKVGKD